MHPKTTTAQGQDQNHRILFLRCSGVRGQSSRIPFLALINLLYHHITEKLWRVNRQSVVSNCSLLSLSPELLLYTIYVGLSYVCVTILITYTACSCMFLSVDRWSTVDSFMSLAAAATWLTWMMCLLAERYCLQQYRQTETNLDKNVSGIKLLIDLWICRATAAGLPTLSVLLAVDEYKHMETDGDRQSQTKTAMQCSRS